MPTFSVILTTYNRESFILKAVNSVLNQTFSDWELIIIDDGSTDNTRNLISGIIDDQIKYIFQPNKERSAARNNGIRNASGRYIIFLDSDDYFLSDYLHQLYNEIEKRGFPIAFFSCGYLNVDVNQRILSKVSPLPEHDNFLKYVFENYNVINQIACIHQEILKNHLYEPRFSLWEDTHLWMRVVSEYPYYSLPIYQVAVLQHIQSTVNIGMQKVKLFDVNRYMAAIDDLFANYFPLLKKNEITFSHKQRYKDAKLNMYFYQARVNKQFKTAFIIGFEMLTNLYNFKNLKSLLKLPIHFLIYKVK